MYDGIDVSVCGSFTLGLGDNFRLGERLRVFDSTLMMASLSFSISLTIEDSAAKWFFPSATGAQAERLHTRSPNMISIRLVIRNVWMKVRFSCCLCC